MDRNNRAPTWYMVIVSVILAALIYIGIVRPYIPLAQGEPIAASYIDMNQYVGQEIPPNRYYASVWGELDYIEGFLFLFLGLVCFVLGIMRAINRLGSRQIFLTAIFSVLFALMFLSLTNFAAARFSPQFRFYLYWVTFFTYPIALFLHFLDCFSPLLRRWLWAPFFLCAAYGAAAFLMYFVFGLPFDMPERNYTYMALVGSVIYVGIGSFRAKDKTSIIYMRVIAVLSVVSGLRLLIMTWSGTGFSLHNEYKAYLLWVAAFMTIYTLFLNMRELVGYRTGMHMMEARNEYVLENYQVLENSMSQIVRMRHEIRHHMFAIGQLCESGEYERLKKYINDMQGEFADTDEPIFCDNRVIQAILGHAARRAKKLGFEIEFEVLPLPPLSVSDTDLVSLFMNILDNALESCARIPEAKDRWIKVKLKARAPYMCISVRNARQGEIKKYKGTYLTTHKNALLHGHGLSVIKQIVEKHSALASFNHTDDAFDVEVALPID